jgi:hypothetical protein
MARIRTIKPEFWTDPKIVTLPYEARLLFIGMLNFSDDHGYQPDEPLRIKMQVFPGDTLDVGALLELVVQAGLVSRVVSSDGCNWLHIVNFSKHQAVNHPRESRYSPVTVRDRSRTDPVALPSRSCLNGMEWNGKEGTPPTPSREPGARPRKRTEITEPPPGPLSTTVSRVLAKSKPSEEEPPRSFEERTAPARSATAPGRNRREDQLRCPTLLAGGERCNRMLAWSETRGGYYFCKRSGSNGCGADYHLADGWCVEGGAWTNGPNGRYNVGGVLKRNGAAPREVPDTEALDEIRALEADRAAHPEKYGVPADLADPFGGET